MNHQEIRLGDMDITRALFERATCLSLPPKKMKVYLRLLILIPMVIFISDKNNIFCSFCSRSTFSSRNLLAVTRGWSMLREKHLNMWKAPNPRAISFSRSIQLRDGRDLTLLRSSGSECTNFDRYLISNFFGCGMYKMIQYVFLE